MAKVRETLDSRRAEHDVKRAQRRAEDAEEYAAYAVAFAYSAVVEAEYAALDAALARLDAEQQPRPRPARVLTLGALDGGDTMNGDSPTAARDRAPEQDVPRASGAHATSTSPSGPGEIVALVGQNGSGKSTLVKILAGVQDADPGARVGVRGSGSHVIHQDLGLIPQLNTVENLDLGRRHGSGAALPTRRREEAEHARELLRQFDAAFDVTVPGGPADAGGADDRRDRARPGRVGAPRGPADPRRADGRAAQRRGRAPVHGGARAPPRRGAGGDLRLAPPRRGAGPRRSRRRPARRPRWSPTRPSPSSTTTSSCA